MTRRSLINRLGILLILTGLQTVVAVRIDAQELDKEVYVIRPYEPNLTEADRISFFPEIEDIPVQPVEFQYAISPSRIPTAFEIDPIKPARMVAVTLPKIYNSWLKLGLGNYLTPLAAFNISNVRSREYAYGASLYHKSSHSKIILANNDKVPGGYVHNDASLYGKRFYTNAMLSAELHFQHRGFNYYGYNTEKFPGSLEISRDSIRQNTYLGGLQTAIASTYTDSSHLNYRVQADYDFFTDRQENIENIVSVNAGVDKNFDILQTGLNIDVDHFNLRSQHDTSTNTVVRIYPWIGKRNADWQFTLGFEAVADITGISKFYLYPRAHLEIIIVENVLVPFFGVSGELQTNNYQQLTVENPFIIPGLRLKNTSRDLVAYGGIKGSISTAVRFRADVNYSVNKDMHFFVNDTVSDILENEFNAEYDDVDLIVYHGQLSVQPSSRIEFTLDGNYYVYNMVNLEKPWHKPAYDFSFGAYYRPVDKISITGDMTWVGPRYAKNRFWPDGMQELKPALDFNLKFQYQYSKVFSLFFDLYNLSGRSYLIWNQYPSQRFNFMAGFSYKL